MLDNDSSDSRAQRESVGDRRDIRCVTEDAQFAVEGNALRGLRGAG